MTQNALKLNEQGAFEALMSNTKNSSMENDKPVKAKKQVLTKSNNIKVGNFATVSEKEAVKLSKTYDLTFNYREVNGRYTGSLKNAAGKTLRSVNDKESTEAVLESLLSTAHTYIKTLN